MNNFTRSQKIISTKTYTHNILTEQTGDYIIIHTIQVKIFSASYLVVQYWTTVKKAKHSLSINKETETGKQKSRSYDNIVNNYMVKTELTGTQEKTFTLDTHILGSFQRKYYLNSQFKPHAAAHTYKPREIGTNGSEIQGHP